METQQVVLDRDKARELWRDYRKHQHWSAPIDREVMHAYQAVAQGKVVIKALHSIVTAGLGEDNLPKLAIVQADEPFCWLNTSTDGSAHFTGKETQLWRDGSKRFDFPAGSFPGISTQRWRPRAITPQIPLPLRPKRALAAYHILFEAEWTLVPPTDPMLLRRIGRTDLWVVMAAWDLTEIERAALASRVRA